MSRLAIGKQVKKSGKKRSDTWLCYCTVSFFQPRTSWVSWRFPCVTHVFLVDLSFQRRRQQPKTAKRTHRTHAYLITTMSTSFRLPYGYNEAPPWPSLYWPFSSDFVPINLIADVPHSLYYLNGNYILWFIPVYSTKSILDIWRYTTIWSVLFATLVYLPAGRQTWNDTLLGSNTEI